MVEKILLSAKFNPKVKQYWLVSWLLVSTLTLIGIPLLLISVPLFLFFSGRMLKAMSAKLTDRKLVVKRGILFKVEKSIPLEKITDVAMSQGPLMRLFNLHRLSFETAGQSGPGALVSLIGIVDASEFREAILAQKDVMSVSATNDTMAAIDSQSGLEQLTDSVKRIELLLEQLVEMQKNK